MSGELEEGEVDGGAELAVDAQDFFTEEELQLGGAVRFVINKIKQLGERRWLKGTVTRDSLAFFFIFDIK